MSLESQTSQAKAQTIYKPNWSYASSSSLNESSQAKLQAGVSLGSTRLEYTLCYSRDLNFRLKHHLQLHYQREKYQLLLVVHHYPLQTLLLTHES